MRTRLLSVVALLGLTGCVPAARPPLPFLERNYAAKVPSDTSLLYEGQAAAHILLIDGLPLAYERISTDTAALHGDAFRLIITPMFRIRQLHDSSAAVRTPSFMPRISGEWLRPYRLGKVTFVSRDTAKPSTTTFGGVPVPRADLPRTQAVGFPYVLLAGLRLTLAHHSNGQAGCFRQGFVPENHSPFNCLPERDSLGRVKDTTTVALNRANGDFSSTFMNVTLHGTLMNRDSANGDRPTWSAGGLLGFDYQFGGNTIPGVLTKEQRDLYGGSRLRGQLELMRFWLNGRNRLTLEGEWVPSLDSDLSRRIHPSIERYRYAVELSHSSEYALGAGMFIRWHRGQDYYNIGFAKRRDVFMWGAMLDVSGLDRIGPRIVQ